MTELKIRPKSKYDRIGNMTKVEINDRSRNMTELDIWPNLKYNRTRDTPELKIPNLPKLTKVIYSTKARKRLMETATRCRINQIAVIELAVLLLD